MRTRINISIIKWASKLPAYSLIRSLGGAHSKLESRYHSKRRVPSLAMACGCTVSEVEDALNEAIESMTLKRLWEKRSELPWEGFFRAAPEMFAICRLTNPSLVIETGVGTGFSSTHILEALKMNGNGTLVSVDLPNADPDWKLGKGVSAGFLVPENLRSRWRLILGDSKKELPRMLANDTPVDIFFHDSEHTYETMNFEFNIAWPHIRNGGFLISDDAVWTQALPELARKERKRIAFIFHTGGSFPIAYLKK